MTILNNRNLVLAGLLLLITFIAYIPAIRRARRMSPANRSDAFVGSDLCVDDAWGYAGKVNNFEWKVLRKEQQLVPFFDTDPQPLQGNDEGEYVVYRRFEGAIKKETIIDSLERL